MYNSNAIDDCRSSRSKLEHNSHTWHKHTCVVVFAVAAEEGEEPVPPPGVALDEAAKAMQLEGLFLFAVVWSVGATCDAAGREKFDNFFR
jgi:hypothetical protein